MLFCINVNILFILNLYFGYNLIFKIIFWCYDNNLIKCLSILSWF